jgi:hypothetical protein
MKEVKVVRRTSLPARIPVSPTLLSWLLLDHFKSPGWIWGVTGTLIAMLWVGWVICIIRETETDVEFK